MKHYTAKELTGLTKEEEKTKNILFQLWCWFDDHKTHKTDREIAEGRTDVLITRYEMRLDVIGKAFGEAVDRLTFFKIMDTLLIQGYLMQNPTSHITPKHHKILPTNDTRYYVCGEEAKVKWNALTNKKNEFIISQKGKNILSLSTSQMKLNQNYNQPVSAMVQEEVTDKLINLNTSEEKASIAVSSSQNSE